jgi:tetratricopeptide (TPR) repeat protein
VTALPYATPETETAAHWARKWLPALAAAVLALLLYVHTLAGTFIYDDTFQAMRDPRLADVRLWTNYLTEGYFPGATDNLWRPLVSLSYAIQFQLHAPNPIGFHLVNILLHAATSALVAEFARRLTNPRAALIAGLLFAAHPVHVEAVAYIVGRAESLCLIGMLGALVLAARPLTTARAWAILACTFAAIFSKEQGLLTPLLLLALVWLRRAQGQWSPDEKRPARLLAAALTLALSAYITYRNHILPWYWETGLLDYAIQPMIHSGLPGRILIPFALLGRYTALLIAPVKLSPDYGLAVITHEQSPGDPYLWLGFITLAAAIIAAVLALRRKDRTTLFLLSCTALTYFMIGNAMLIGTIFGERLIYIPSAFVLILAAAALARLPNRALVPTLVILLSLYSLRAFTYAAQWGDRLAFYETAVRDNPRAVRLHVILARELLAQGKLDRAREIVEKGLAVSTEDWRLWIAAAQIAIAQQRWDDARAAMKQAWNKDPYIGDVLALEREFADRPAATRPTTRP